MNWARAAAKTTKVVTNRHTLGGASRSNLVTKSKFSDASEKSCGVHSLPRTHASYKDDFPCTPGSSRTVHMVSEYEIRKVEDLLELK